MDLNSFEYFSYGIVQAEDISPDVRYLLLHFKFHEQFGNVTVANVADALKPFWGKTRIRTTVNKALEAGYMKREYIQGNKGGRWIKYHVACYPAYNTNKQPNFNND